MEIFLELGLILGTATLMTVIMRLLKQPLIIGYIVTGILVGPYFLDAIGSQEMLSTFSHIGISLLLFIVGLSLSPKVIKDVGKVSAVTGIGQVLFASLIGFFIARLLGFSTIVSLYVAVALTFSSTIIIMKLLSDKRDTDALYGRISIGFLIVQDIIAMFILMIIPSIPAGLDITAFIFGIVLRGVGLLVLLFLIGRYILPGITKAIAKSQEFLLLFSVAWCFALAGVFHYLNFAMEIGALLAGIALSFSEYRYEISSKMKPLRDFFIVLFFIFLGTQMDFSSIGLYIAPILIFSVFILVGNPLIVMTLMGALGYTRRNSFLAGLTVAQISEFSLILIALGVTVGHLTNEVLSFITAIGLTTIAGSTYMIYYSNRIYPKISKYLKVFERKGEKVDEHKYHEHGEYDVILFGYDRIGHDLLESFKKIKKSFLVVDYNPETIIDLAKEDINCRYGDASDSELLEDLSIPKAKMIVSTIPDFDTNHLLINKIRQSNEKAIVIVVSHQIDEAMELYAAGATYIVMPHFLGGRLASTLIEQNKLSFSKFIQNKSIHIEELLRRKELGHEHPKNEKQ